MALVLGALGSGVAFASARTANWVVSVTYQNVGTSPATVLVDFYAEGSGTPISFNPLGAGNTLGAGAGASLCRRYQRIAEWIQRVCVVSSDQPLVASAVQFSNDSGFKMRLLSNGFTSDDAASQFLVATVLSISSATRPYSQSRTRESQAPRLR